MLYEATVTAFTQQLSAISVIIEKAEALCAAKKIDPSVLFNARLAPDMLPFWRQVTIACDFAKGTPSRLAGVEPPKFADDEKTLEELKARIAKTLAYTATLDAKAVDAAPGKTISFPGGGKTRSMEASAYALRYATPNFYFHCATAYDILRHNGLEVGKRDFMGQVAGLTEA